MVVTDLELDRRSVVCDVARGDWSTIYHIDWERCVSRNCWNLELLEEVCVDEVVGCTTVNHGHGVKLTSFMVKGYWDLERV